MNDQEAHDLLIEMAANQKAMKDSFEKRLDKIEHRLGERRCHTNAEKIRVLEEKTKDLPTTTEKVKSHDRIYWAALLAALAANVKAWFFSGGQ